MMLCVLLIAFTHTLLKLIMPSEKLICHMSSSEPTNWYPDRHGQLSRFYYTV